AAVLVMVRSPLALSYFSSFFFFLSSRPTRHLHSFPTRRSSDLAVRREGDREHSARVRFPAPDQSARAGVPQVHLRLAAEPGGGRSEEHTSELQSHLNLVCRLLLEKKKHNKDTLRNKNEVQTMLT